MPRCGNCKQSHDTVADVRACYEHAGRPTVTTATATVSKADGPMWPPSDGQIRYVLGLQEERNLPDDYKVKDRPMLEAMEKDEVSGVINLLKTFSLKPGASSGRKQYTMPEGRYALQDNDAKWSFFQVDKPDKGRWAGYTFIKRLIGAPGQYRKETVQATVRYSILDRIERDPKKAMVDYGLQSGVCGRCASPLTDPDSLTRGLGPVCRNKLGW